MVFIRNVVNKKTTLLVSSLALALVYNLTSCSKDQEKKDVETEEVSLNEIFTVRIQNIIDDLTSVLSKAEFGYNKGQYPVASKNLLVDRIAYLEEAIEKLNNGTRKLNKIDMDNIIAISNTVKNNFLISVLKEDFKTEPAELYVDGKSGGYIDFGYSPEYSSFSNGFTVELWTKIESFGDFDWILSTFVDNDNNEDRHRYGWGINFYGENGLRLLRMTYTLGKDGLFEPGLDYYPSSQWVHLAFVWNPNKANNVDTAPNHFKMYINGELVKYEDFHRTDYTPNLKTNLVGFNLTRFDGSISPSHRGTNGRMKHMHIWNSVKNQAQIKDVRNNPDMVQGNEVDLVAGWRFDKTVPDVTNIPDLTGRHSAKLVGEYKWFK